MTIVVVLVHTQEALDILNWAARTRPELYRVSSGHLALLAIDKVSDFVVFDGPMGLLEYADPYVRLLDLERGVEREVVRDHLNAAIAFKILEKLF